MKKNLIVLAVMILAQMMFLTGYYDKSQAKLTPDQLTAEQPVTYTTLRTPFNGNDAWYMTQAFGAYYYEETMGINGHHTGEDWNLGAGDDDAGAEVYPIATGTVIDWGTVFKGDSDGKKGGFYIIVKHEGEFKIPESSGAHIKSLKEPEHEEGRASNNGYAMLYAKDLFGEGELTDYDLDEEDNDGSYSYKEATVDTIYSVYMHIEDPSSYIKDLGDSKEITADKLDEPIGKLMGGMEFSSHLHFEIRVGDNDESVKRSVLPGNQEGGYFTKSQDMVDAGYREPSIIIQANGGQGSISDGNSEEKAITATFLILDVSSSMNDNWQGGVKIVSARTAATQMLELIGRENEAYGLNHHIGIVSFADTAHLEMNLSPEVAQAQEVVSGLDAYGNTNIGAALELANTQLQELNAQKKIMVLLSDGQTNRGLSREGILAGPVAQAQAQGIVIYTIGFGDPGDLDEEFLKNIAVASGGSYSYAASGHELQNVYLLIRHEATGKVLADLSGTIKQGETKELADIVIERGVAQAHFTLNWAGSTLELTLKDPRGKVVQEDYPRAKIFREKPLYVIVEDPQPGTWSASIYGKNVPEESLAYNFIASARQKEGFELSLSNLIILAGIGIATMGVAIIFKGIFRRCCPDCSMKLEPGTRFCPWCGRKVR